MHYMNIYWVLFVCQTSVENPRLELCFLISGQGLWGHKAPWEIQSLRFFTFPKAGYYLLRKTPKTQNKTKQN